MSQKSESQNELPDDSHTTVSELRQWMQTFVDQRDWQQFHSPKNLAMSLAIEAGELMEHFQWISMDESRSIDEQQRHDVAEELADVICYAMSIANSLNLDVATAVHQKMIKNRLKYPAEDFKGRFG
ncbi:MAG: nucleotide pyrophosphohydrolase [Planctomycetota bacterium]